MSLLLSRIEGCHYHISKFHIYVLVTVLVFFFLAYFTLYNQLQFHPSQQNWFKCILFNGWVILHCVYVPHFLIHSSADGHLGCFHVLAIINSATLNFWTQRERERVGWFGRMALKHVYCHIRNESPVYVRCRIQDAWGWCTGMTQRDGERGGRGGSGLGTHVHPWRIHVDVWQNQYSIVK